MLREDVFNWAKAQAYLSGLPFHEYVAWQLAQAKTSPQGSLVPANSEASSVEDLTHPNSVARAAR